MQLDEIKVIWSQVLHRNFEFKRYSLVIYKLMNKPADSHVMCIL